MPITVAATRRETKVPGYRAWRASLPFGSFLPSDQTNGLLYGTNIATMTHVNPGASTITLAATDYYDTIWWGKIKAARPGYTNPGAHLHNCAAAGPRPDLVTPGAVFYIIQATDLDTGQWEADDLLVNPFLWMRSDAPGGPWTETQVREAYINAIGLKGGNVTLRNAHILNCMDDWQVTQARNGDADTRFSLAEHCWLEKPLFYQGPLWPSQPEGVHSDNLQPQTGRNFTVRGGLIGGPDDPESLTSWGCGVTWKQETWAAGPEADRRMDNYEWDRVMFWSSTGGNFNMNIAYNPSYPNEFLTSSIHDCLFVTRADGKYVNRNATRYAHLDSTTNRKISDPTSGSWSDLGAINYTNG